MAVSWIQIALDAENLPIAHKILISVIVCQVSVQSVILLTSNEVFRLNLVYFRSSNFEGVYSLLTENFWD